MHLYVSTEAFMRDEQPQPWQHARAHVVFLLIVCARKMSTNRIGCDTKHQIGKVETQNVTHRDNQVELRSLQRQLKM